MKAFLVALRAVPERLLTPRRVLVAACLLLIASWAYPPGFERESRHVSRGWFFLFDTDSDMQVDFPRLILLDAIIAAGAGMVAWSVSGSSSSRGTVVRLAFYLMVGVPVLAVAGGTLLVCVWVFPQAEAWANQPQKQLPATLTDADFADPNDFGGGPVSAVHLKRITLSDVQASQPDAYLTETGRVITSFRGRLRNGLSRPIVRVVIKVSILRPSGQVVEARRYKAHYWVPPVFRETYLPDEPASFEINDTISNLPEGVTWKLEVVEAYAN